jgi:hypothetical protein
MWTHLSALDHALGHFLDASRAFDDKVQRDLVGCCMDAHAGSSSEWLLELGECGKCLIREQLDACWGGR